jgi:hypothetical protein
MVRTFCLVFALLPLATAAWAQNNQMHPQNAAEDRACRGDAHRFCREDIPDEFRVASCLQTHREQISRACRSVLETHGM